MSIFDIFKSKNKAEAEPKLPPDINELTKNEIAIAHSNKKPKENESKFGGKPYLPADFTWPYYNGEDYDGVKKNRPLTFLAQIDLHEAHPFDRDSVLPDHGMLYFFYDLDEMPYDPNDTNACRVIYHPVDDHLQQLMLVDEDGQDLSFREMAIDFECVEEGFLAEEDGTHLLLGVPSIDNGYWSECIDGWQMLFQLDSIETDDTCVNFSDEGVLCFFIDKDKLEEKDFSDVRIMQIHY